MNRTGGSRFCLVAFVATLIAGAPQVGSAAQRTFVASSGNDAFACTLLQPCRSFAAAIANTNANGEIVVLDSAGYGPVTITKSVSIVAPPGIYAGVSVFAGDGVTINGSGINVLLRGLTINGQGGDNGIRFLQGATLVVENCEVDGMGANGLNADAAGSQITVRDSVFRRNAFIGAVIGGDASMRMTISNSLFADNAVGVASVGQSSAFVATTVARSTISGNGAGFQVQASSGASASILSDGNTITFASLAAFFFTGLGGSEVIFSPGNNTIGYIGTVAMGGTITSCCAQ